MKNCSDLKSVELKNLLREHNIPNRSKLTTKVKMCAALANVMEVDSKVVENKSIEPCKYFDMDKRMKQAIETGNINDLTVAEIERCIGQLQQKQQQPVNSNKKNLLIKLETLLKARYPDIERSAKFVEKLLPAEKLAIDKFQLGDQMNVSALGITLTNMRNIVALDKIFEKAPKTKQPMFLYRGLHTKNPILSNLTVYQSTSLSKKVSAEFATGGVLLMIHIGEGIPILNVSERQNNFQSELEVILPRQGHFQVATPAQREMFNQQAIKYKFHDYLEMCDLYGAENLVYVNFVYDEQEKDPLQKQIKSANDIQRRKLSNVELLKQANIKDFQFPKYGRNLYQIAESLEKFVEPHKSYKMDEIPTSKEIQQYGSLSKQNSEKVHRLLFYNEWV